MLICPLLSRIILLFLFLAKASIKKDGKAVDIWNRNILQDESTVAD
jgi:hypothetical protein